MKKVLAILLGVTLLLGMVGTAAAADKTVINLWTFTTEVPGMIDKYMALNPDFAAQYEVVSTVINDQNNQYATALDAALLAGGADAPDMYTAESAFVLKYTQGDASSFAAPYADLGMGDVDQMVLDAEIAKYAVEIGTRDGVLVGLPYQATGAGMIYRRSIAIDVWGTDDPAVIAEKTGPGWDKFLEAAAELKAKGYAVVSGAPDIWQAIRTGGEQPWIVDGVLTLDPYREAYIDYAKTLYDNGYMNDTTAWSDAWYADMDGLGAQPVFAFFGPAWLINYVMINHSTNTFGDWAVTTPPVGFFWGGTWIMANKDSDVKEAVGQLIEWITLDTSDTGLQYYWANGTMVEGTVGTKDTVSSGVVMAKSDGTVAYLGGQNMFDVFVPANQYASGASLTQYDQTINDAFNDQVQQYKLGQKTREEAIADWKTTVADNLDVVTD
jgi:multiple sugar transport system substrate-binding protein